MALATGARSFGAGGPCWIKIHRRGGSKPLGGRPSGNDTAKSFPTKLIVTHEFLNEQRLNFF